MKKLDYISVIKKRTEQKSKTFTKLIYPVFFVFAIVASLIIKNALSIKDTSSIILFVFLLVFLIVLAVIFLAFNKAIKSTVKRIEFSSNEVLFYFSDTIFFKIDKSEILSIIAETIRLGEYQTKKFYVVLKPIPINSHLYASKYHKALQDFENVSFTTEDLKDNELNVNDVIEFFKANYGDIFSLKN